MKMQLRAPLHVKNLLEEFPLTLLSQFWFAMVFIRKVEIYL